MSTIRYYTIECSHCSRKARISTATQLLTNPPQYRATCDHCGGSTYICADDLHLYADDGQSEPSQTALTVPIGKTKVRLLKQINTTYTTFEAGDVGYIDGCFCHPSTPNSIVFIRLSDGAITRIPLLYLRVIQ